MLRKLDSFKIKEIRNQESIFVPIFFSHWFDSGIMILTSVELRRTGQVGCDSD